MAGATEYEISLGSVAPAAAMADRLVAELAGQGVGTEAEPNGAISVTAVSVASLSTVASLLFRSAERGLVLDVSGPTARIELAVDLPRGSLRILRQRADPQTREGLTAQQVGYLMRTALAAMEV
jgi:hypothetical protein